MSLLDNFPFPTVATTVVHGRSQLDIRSHSISIEYVAQLVIDDFATYTSVHIHLCTSFVSRSRSGNDPTVFQLVEMRIRLTGSVHDMDTR